MRTKLRHLVEHGAKVVGRRDLFCVPVQDHLRQVAHLGLGKAAGHLGDLLFDVLLSFVTGGGVLAIDRNGDGKI